jgi:hypothetical protein
MAKGRAGLIRVGVVSAYALLALVTTFPLAVRLTTHVPMPRYLLAQPWRHVHWFALWSLWLAKRTVSSWPPFALSTELLFYPVGVAIPSIVQTLSTAILAVPLQSLFNIVAVGNIVLLVALTLAGYFAFLLAYHITGDRLASLVSGAVYAASPIVIANAQGHLYVISGLPWMPLYLLFLLETLDRPTRKHALAAGLVFAVSMLSYWYYAAFLVVFTAVIGLQRFLRTEGKADFVRTLAAPAAVFLAVVVPMTMLLAVPFVLPATRALPATPLQSAISEMREWSVDLLAFFLPAYDHWLFGGSVAATRAAFSGNLTLQTAYVGYTALALAGWACVRAARSLTRPWIWCGVVFFVLALGPALHVNGIDHFAVFGRAVTVPLPQVLVSRVLPFSAIRDLSMYVLPLMLCVAVLAALGLHVLLGRRAPSARFPLAAAIGVLVLAEFSVLPFPLFAARLPAPYRFIADDPDRATVLDLPWSNAIPLYQYYQTAHGKPLLSGYLNRVPPEYERFGDGFPIVTRLKNPGAGQAASDSAESAADFLRLFRVRYVVVHRDIAGAEESRRLTAIINAAFPLRFLGEDGGTAVYRVEPQVAPRPLPLLVDFPTAGPEPVLTLGWATPEEREGVTAAWAEGTTSSLWASLPSTQSLSVTIKVEPFVYPAAERQTVRLFVNGRKVDTVAIAQGWSTQTFHVPREFLQDGADRFDFGYDHCAVPAQVVRGSSDRRCLSVAFDFIRME